MNQKIKSNSISTIEKLSAKINNEKAVSLKSNSENINLNLDFCYKDDAHRTLHESNKVFIEDKLKSNNFLINGSKLGPDFDDDYGRIKRPLLSNISKLAFLSNEY